MNVFSVPAILGDAPDDAGFNPDALPLTVNQIVPTGPSPAVGFACAILVDQPQRAFRVTARSTDCGLSVLDPLNGVAARRALDSPAAETLN